MFPRPLPVDQLQAFDNAIRSMIDVYGAEHVFAADNIITFDRHVGFGKDAKFVEAIVSQTQNPAEHALAWRFHVLCWAARHAEALPGDFVQCGLSEGFSAAVVARYMGFGDLPKRFWLYDRFEDGAATGRERRERLAGRFATFPNAVLPAGDIPAAFSAGAPERISWLHLDLDEASATIGALERLFDRLVTHGVVILDDFGSRQVPGLFEAASLFAKDRGHVILEMPTGQGFLIKH